MTSVLSGPAWDCLWPLGAELGEGAIWDADNQRLWFVDIQAPAVHRFDPVTGAHDSWTPPWRIGSIALRASGGLIAGTEDGFAAIDPEHGLFTLLDDPEAGPALASNRFNDGKVDAHGMFWAGTMDETKLTRQGSLYRLGADLGWTRSDAGYRISNGPAFSPDGHTLYHNDTLDRITFALDVDADGVLTNKRVLVVWPVAMGAPDGLTTDCEGYLWQTFWGGSCVRRVSPAGVVGAEYPLPVTNVTSCAFGGARLERLFVTTARQGLNAGALAAQPLAGGLFEIFPGVTGCPGGIFAG
jgi:D-xylonolactonase